MGKPVVATLLGPTASGKTELAIQLAQEMDVSIISVDSAMVYRGLDIGTAKPDLVTRAQFPHALVDIRDPEESFSVQAFCTEADQAIRTAWEGNQVPLLVGGSMMYFRAFRDGLANLPPANQRIRASIRAQADAEGVESVFQNLKAVDPKTASLLDPCNLRRIERALEVLELTGKPLVDLWEEKAVEGAERRLNCELVEFVTPTLPRPEVHQRIETRLHGMFEAGFIQEVVRLRARPGLTQSSLSMRTVGYRELWQYLEEGDSEAPDDILFEKVLVATRQLARKQHTWLRQWQDRNLQVVDRLDAMIERLKY